MPAEEVRRLKKERDDLKDAVSSFETQLLDIQMDTKILAEDRDNFKLLYQQVGYYACYFNGAITKTWLLMVFR